MELLTHPNTQLRKVATDVVFFDELLRAIVNELMDVMYLNLGCGIAAPQVGINRKIIIVDPSSGEDANQMIVMVNPKILASRGSVESTEGCLSLPGVQGKVQRSSEVDVEFQTLTGETKRMTATGTLAIIVQHEVDHLFGILFVDRMDGEAVQGKKLRKTA